MARTSGWELLEAGQYEAALKRLKEEYAQGGSIAYLTSMGTTYLCMRDFAAAKRLFDEALHHKDAFDSSSANADAGLARWLLGEFHDAVEHWKGGLNCTYTEGAGGIELPLLLYYAGVRRPEIYQISEAKKLFTKRLRSSWAKNWPGPIAQYAVDRIDEAKLKELARFEVEVVEHQQVTQADFYVGVKAIESGNTKEFSARMKRLAAQRRCEVLYERFLAIHEIESVKKRPVQIS